MSTFLLLCLNVAIAWWNCYAVGSSWAESKAVGGFARVVAWSGAIQSAIGFSMAIGAVELGVLHLTGHLPPRVLHGALSLWYLLIIMPCIGSGLALTAHSWSIFMKEKSISNLGVAAWNTYAQIHNMYGAIDGIGSSFSSLKDLFSSDDEDDSTWQLVLALVAISLLGGVLLAKALIQKYAASATPIQRGATA